jgi:hypothetical protein
MQRRGGIWHDMKKRQTRISDFTAIYGNQVFLNSRLVFSYRPEAGFEEFINACYLETATPYDRFYKMDKLCKLGYITADRLLNGSDLIRCFRGEEIGMIVANSSSSLNSDNRFQQGVSLDDPLSPEPAVFIYTLPNMVIGELSIRFGIKGENLFVVNNEPDFGFLTDWVDDLVYRKKIKACIVGWIDIDMEDHYESFLCAVETKDVETDIHTLPFSRRNLNKLFYDREKRKE